MSTEDVALHDLDPALPSASGAPPVLAGRYHLERRIAAGGMGVVWRATDSLLARTVAVKQLLLAPHLDESAAEEARARAAREARIAARLHHPAAVAVFDIVEEGGNPWLVMEYLPSRNLADVLAEDGPLPPLQVARIGAQVAGALAAAHAAGIVHRDVKPANVLLGDDGTVKITDFGVSRAAWEVAVTQTGMVAGTPAYLAPEVAQGLEPTEAADVFALGATLYAAAEGEPPFGSSANPLAQLRRVADGEIVEPRAAGPMTEPLHALLAVDPEDRPSAAEAASMLAVVAADAPGTDSVSPPTVAVIAPHAPTPADADITAVLAADGPPERRHRPWWHRRVLIGALATCLAVLAGLVVVPALSGSGEQSTTTSAPAFVTPPADPELVRATVQDYFAVLPTDTDAAWSFLGEAERARVGGPDAYRQWWSNITYVNPTTEIAVNGYSARLELLFQRTDGTATIEPYELMVRSNPGGRPIIEAVNPAGPARRTTVDRKDTASGVVDRVDDGGQSAATGTATTESAAAVPEPTQASEAAPPTTEVTPVAPSAPSTDETAPPVEELPDGTNQDPSVGAEAFTPETVGDDA